MPFIRTLVTMRRLSSLSCKSWAFGRQFSLSAEIATGQHRNEDALIIIFLRLVNVEEIGPEVKPEIRNVGQGH